MRPVISRTTCAAAIVAGALAGAHALVLDQLAERPLTGVLTHPAIEYGTRPTTDAVAELNRRLEDGTSSVVLSYDERSGYLQSTLDALRVPAQSQMLVMSKTGIQGLHTGPENPRAMYFNDAVTVGYIRGAPLLELAVQDPQQGVVFYTLDQKPQARPVFERRRDCLRCHQVYSTLHVPGLVARSVFVAADGMTLGQFGSYDPDDRSPFRQRWGGWYVTGTHGAMRHMGNAILTKPDEASTMISERTLNRTSLEGLFDARGYPSAHSDIVALMVFQHQVHMTNLITRLGWETRLAAHAKTLDFANGPLRQGVIELVDYLLFVDEELLTAPVKGTSGFAETFAAQGPADRQGRSLRHLDLERRLMRYPCSYMIHSPAFRALPADAREAIYRRIWEVVAPLDAHPKYLRLSKADRRAVIEILRDTLPDLPADFRAPQDR